MKPIEPAQLQTSISTWPYSQWSGHNFGAGILIPLQLGINSTALVLKWRFCCAMVAHMGTKYDLSHPSLGGQRLDHGDR